jgi:hypothetical protein
MYNIFPGIYQAFLLLNLQYFLYVIYYNTVLVVCFAYSKCH